MSPGGAPELNPNFRRLAVEARKMGKIVYDRCNLTVFFEKGQEDTPEFLAENSVTVIASLPCYSPENVDKQRGKGVFGKSIKALQRLNALGYGKPDSGLELNLVYNPVGPHLPPPARILVGGLPKTSVGTFASGLQHFIYHHQHAH